MKSKNTSHIIFIAAASALLWIPQVSTANSNSFNQNPLSRVVGFCAKALENPNLDEMDHEDLTLSSEAKSQLIERMAVRTKGHLDGKADHAIELTIYGKIVDRLTAYLHFRNPNKYRYHYTQKEVPQRARLTSKVSFDTDQFANKLAKFGIEMKGGVLESFKSSSSKYDKGKSKELAAGYFEELLGMIDRYLDLEKQLRKLDVSAGLKQNNVNRLEELLKREDIDFPFRVRLSDVLNNDFEITETTYVFESKKEILRAIKRTKHIEAEKFGKLFDKNTHYQGRYEEQAELYGELTVFLSEFQTFTSALRDSSLRERMITLLTETLRQVDLLPPQIYMVRQKRYELSWEVSRYLGHRMEIRKGEGPSGNLWQNDQFDLGIMENQMTGLQRLRRLAFLTLPLQGIATLGTLVWTVGLDYGDNFLNNSHRAVVVENKNDVQYANALVDYFKKDYNFDITQPTELWPEEVANEYRTIQLERDEYLLEMHEKGLGVAQLVQAQAEFRRLNKNIDRNISLAMSTDEISTQSISEADKVLVHRMRRDANRMKNDGLAVQDIRKKLFIRYSVLPAIQ